MGTIRFSGYNWHVKTGNGLGPGPCNWSDSNAWVDSVGYLHLKLTHREGTWRCAEVKTVRSFGLGSYQFQVIGEIDKLDRNVVFGMFSYPTPDVGEDGTHEIDIEIARWGTRDPASSNLNFNVWPTSPDVAPSPRATFFSLNGTHTTHRFARSRTSVLFQSLHGHRNDDRYRIERWNFAPPRNAASLISRRAMPVHLNLWLFHGQAPSDGREVEIVVKKFTYASS